MERLRQVKPQLAAFGVSKLGLFGSYVRGEATAKSDIDILIDFVDRDHSSLHNLMGTYKKLKRVFVKRKIDIVSVNGLSKYIGPIILGEVQYV